MDNPMKPPPGAMMTAAPVAEAASRGYAVSVGVVTLTVVSMPPDPIVASFCFHCSDPGATAGQRLMTFAGVAGTGLLLLLSCARGEPKAATVTSHSAMKGL